MVGQGGTDRNRTNAGGDKNAGRSGGGAEATDGYVLYHFLLLSTLLLIIILSGLVNHLFSCLCILNFKM